MKKILLGFLTVAALALAVENAKISVVTDLPGALIYIDGKYVGSDAVQAYAVEPGEHYVSVTYKGKKIFARTYTLAEGEVKAIPTAHFVDFKTGVANRGAVDVEAARIRDTRGNFGAGAYASSTIGGLSLKKWFGPRIGLQAFGLVSNSDKGTTYQSGGKLLIWLADKVAFDAPFSGYMYFGGGGDHLHNTGEAKYNIRRSISNAGVGVEFSPFGVNGLFLSLEAGAEKQFIVYSNGPVDSEKKEGMVWGGGLHLYF